MKKIILLFILVAFLFDGCKKKYPDDNWVPHFRSPVKRLTKHSWAMKSYTKLVNFSYSPLADNFKCGFYIDGTCSGGTAVTYTVGQLSYYPSSNNFNFSQSWELINNDETLKIIHDQNHYTLWKIEELESGTLKISNDSVRLEMTM